MMNNRKSIELGEICEVVRGGSPRPIIDYITDEPDGVNWLKIGDVRETDKYFTHATERIKPSGISKTKEVQCGDLILSNSMSFGRAFITLIDGYIHDGWLRIRCDENIINKEYLYYFLKSNLAQNQFKAIATGSVVNNLKSDTVKAVKISLPTISEQKRVVSILTTLDNKIELNNQINNNLEQEAITLFDSQFSSIAHGDHTIGEYITPKRGKGLLSKDAVSGDVPVVAGGLEPATYHNKANTLAPVLTISASGANAGFVNLWHIPIWSSDSSFIDVSMTNNVFFWYVMLKKRQKEIFDAQTGSAQPHIYPQHISIMPVIDLEPEEMHAYTEQVTPLFNLIGNNLKENIILTGIRDTLLPKLMSGELDVSDLDLDC